MKITKKVLLVSLIFFVLNSCSRDLETEKPILKDPLMYLKDSVVFENTTYDFEFRNESEEYIKTSFKGKNIGRDSIKIYCRGNFATTPSQQIVAPSADFSIGANRVIKGKRGQISTTCTVDLRTLDEKFTHRILLRIDGYVNNVNKD